MKNREVKPIQTEIRKDNKVSNEVEKIEYGRKKREHTMKKRRRKRKNR